MKKVLAIALSLLLMLTVFSGCSTSSNTEATTEAETKPAASAEEQTAPGESKVQENVNLTMWTFLDVQNPTNSRAVALGQLIENFEAANPGITVTVEAQDHSTLPAKYYAAFQAGNGPDVVQVSVSNLATGIEMGAFSTLESLFYSNWSDAEKDDVACNMWEFGANENGHYQVPLFGGVYGILYRSDYFEKFGIKAEDIKTYDDLYEAAKTLTFVNDDGMRVYGLGMGYAISATDANGVLANVLLNKEGTIFNEDGTPNAWDDEMSQAALQMELDAVSMGIMPDTCASQSYEDILVSFESGEYAMVFAPTLRIPTVSAAASFDASTIKFMQYPVWKEGMTNKTSSGGWLTCVNSSSANQEAAGKFLEYLCSSEADEIWVTVGEQVPLRKSTLGTLGDYIAEPGHEWLESATKLRAEAYVAPSSVMTTGMWQDIQDAFLYAYVNGMTPAEALKTASDDFITRNLNR